MNRSGLSDCRRRQRRRDTGVALVGGSGNARAACRSRHRHAAGRRSGRCRRYVSELLAEQELFLVRSRMHALGRRRDTAVSSGAHHGRRLERHGLVGAARRAERLRRMGRGGRGRLGMERCRALLSPARGRSGSRPQPDAAGAVQDPPHAGRGVAGLRDWRSSAPPPCAASARSTTSTRTRSMASSRSRSRRTTTGARRARAAISPARCGGVPIFRDVADARDRTALRRRKVVGRHGRARRRDQGPVGARGHPSRGRDPLTRNAAARRASGRPRSFSASASRRASTGAASGAISRTIPICILR